MSEFKVREFCYRVETDEGLFLYNNATDVTLIDGVLMVQTTICINCFTGYINAYEIPRFDIHKTEKEWFCKFNSK